MCNSIYQSRCIGRALLYESDTLIPTTEFMTREVVIDTLKRVCAAFDQETLNAIAEQVHYEPTVRNLQLEFDLKDERIAQVESQISALKRALADKDTELSEKVARLSEKEAELSDIISKIKNLQKRL